ncbi:hypothetical protein ACG2LH_13360 [Zhouia sp. PK063]|uniref:hypothetical protein n=1 Tax=Zhouia sp. PK063 TaxID=3373602 RepID=UPI0037BD5C05
MNNTTVKEGKNMAIIAYLTIFGVIIAFSMNVDKKNDFASFHIRQSLGLWLLFLFISAFIGYFDSIAISAAFYLVFIVLWIYGFSGALAERKQQIPLVGSLFQSMFASIIK